LCFLLEGRFIDFRFFMARRFERAMLREFE
jgi:hypothetical protein